jgi:hypothetical protein
MTCFNSCVRGLTRNDVLDVAYSYPNGGGYCNLADSGVSETIKHRGSVILHVPISSEVDLRRPGWHRDDRMMQRAGVGDDGTVVCWGARAMEATTSFCR